MANRLARETSPYLQQHAENPVDWYPWSAEALALAREQDKPILLSIGYSACHWCHVMAHESFEDAQVAAEMNRHFVNVKVDREERPDLDQIYQTAHQLLTRRGGGWPLTMVLTPDGTPFFAGTYFPRDARYGMPGFKELLPKIAQAYRDRRATITEQNAALMQALTRSAPSADASGRELTRGPIDEAVRELAQIFDDVEGGLGHAPKFPHPVELTFCLRRHALEGNEVAGAMVKLTLTKMAEGGIFDQLGGGFCRYSTDELWTIPHFEKMLYDNGPLLALYADAWQLTRSPLYDKVAADTAAWVMREMQAPDGGYYSSLDADSEGEEGKFYVWDLGEIRGLLSPPEFEVVTAHYGLDGAPNFEGRHWHLRLVQPLEAVARKQGLPLEACTALLERARAKLTTARATRVRPARDDKILTSWNALMVKGMARAGRVFDRADWVDSARRALEFLRRALWRDGRLLATSKDGRAHLNAYLDDHAFLLDALLELTQADFRLGDLEWAQALADLMLEQFEDRERGGFFFVSHDHEALIHRAKTGHDGATPSGNGTAAFALQRLGHLVGNARYLTAAERAIGIFYESMQRNPGGHTSLLAALDEALTPPRVVVIRGTREALAPWQAQLARTYRPDTMVVAIPSGLTALPANLAAMVVPRPNATAAWVCEGVSCQPPVSDLPVLEAAIAPRAS